LQRPKFVSFESIYRGSDNVERCFNAAFENVLFTSRKFQN